MSAVKASIRDERKTYHQVCCLILTDKIEWGNTGEKTRNLCNSTFLKPILLKYKCTAKTLQKAATVYRKTHFLSHSFL